MKKTLLVCTALVCLLLSYNVASAQQTFTDKTLGWQVTMPDDWNQAIRNIYDDDDGYKKVSYEKGSSGKLAMSTHPLPDEYMGNGKKLIEEDIDGMLETLQTSMKDSKEWSIKWKKKDVTIGGKKFQSLHIDLIHNSKVSMSLDLYEWTDDKYKWVITTNYDTDVLKNTIDKAVKDAASSF